MNLALLSATLPVFMVMAAGFLMRRKDWISESLDAGIMRVALNLLVPCLILDKVIGSEALNQPSNVIYAIGLGFLFVTVGVGISSLLAPIFGLGRGTGKRTFAIASAFQNYGYIAIPVLISQFGEGALGVLFLHGMGVELALWTVAVMVMRGLGKANLTPLINGPFLAVIGSLALHYAGAETWIPAFIQNFFGMLGACAVPMCLFAIGATIANQQQTTPASLHWPTAIGACLLRLIILPSMIIGVVYLLPLSVELKQVLLVQASMPAAIFTIVLAKLYGGHPSTAILVVIATTLGSVMTMPIILQLGSRLLGL